MNNPNPEPPFQLRQLDHLVLRVQDVERMVAFYRDVLGCTPERVVEEAGLWQLRCGVSLIDLVDVAGPLGRAAGAPPGADGHNLDHLCVAVNPFEPDRIRRWLEDHGVAVEEVARRYGAEGFGPSLYLQDPEGNRVELKGPAE